jgi:hypothetical protein
MPEFVSGRELARAFYTEVVATLVGDVEHSAALLGWGSDVLGFDTERSTDHGWGPRLQIFVHAREKQSVLAAVEAGLPEEFGGWPTRFGWNDRPVVHHVEVTDLGEWLTDRVGYDPRAGMTVRDWLATPQQLLLQVVRGEVFHDGSGELGEVRGLLAWYPDDVWLWLIACQWRRIEQEEPFVGRTAEVGDELGSRVLAARLARDAMRLCFLFERRYAPYSKWFGAAFARLDTSSELGPPLLRATVASTFAEREEALGEALLAVARRHNALGITMPMREDLELFHGRPYRVVGAGRFVDATLQRVRDEWLRAQPLVGGIDQYVDSTDVLSAPALARRTRFVYSERP